MPNPTSSPAEIFDRLLDKGIILPPSTEICCPACNPYVLAAVETFMKLVEAWESLPCCYNVSASVETYLKLYEMIPDQEVCEDDNTFIDCLAELQNILSVEDFDRLLDKGIVEMGHIGADGSGGSNICILVNFIQSAFNLQPPGYVSSLGEIIDRILDKGVVIQCIPEGFIMASVETYLKWAEIEGGGPAVPA